MRISTRRWLTEAYCDIRHYRTTVTINDQNILMSVTLLGKFSRKEAINRAWHHLAAETGQWGADFLYELKAAK